jgi:hypothetical protein
MIGMVGWVLFAFTLGVIVGALVVWNHAPKLAPRLSRAELERQPDAVPEQPKATIVSPPEPHDLVKAIITDEVRDRMVQDFVEQDGLSIEDAKRVADEICNAAIKFGSDEPM